MNPKSMSHTPGAERGHDLPRVVFPSPTVLFHSSSNEMMSSKGASQTGNGLGPKLHTTVLQ